ncbi:uncharacterized protein [Henckelia pumila]|uniref:uncharacterized protein n=1 Tax=Henckelia pumila TaxID=405737 RepID=UPI003C6DC224
MAKADQEVQFSLRVTMIKESNKFLYVEVDHEFANVLLSFLTLPLGTIVRLLNKHYGDDAPILGSLNSLYSGLKNLDNSHFWTEAGKRMLLNPRSTSSGINCSGLKVLQIDDTPPIQYFTCKEQSCVSMYYEMRCYCGDSTNTDITEKLFLQTRLQSVFTKETPSFILSDDLEILTNSPASILRLLKASGIEDTKVLEEEL